MTSATVFTAEVASTLDAIEKAYATVPAGMDTLEAWVYNDAEARQACAHRLRGAGWRTVHIRSAYKPLVHAFLDEGETGTAWLADATVSRLVIAYPIAAHASPRRFLLEAYPLAEMARLAGKTIEFTAANTAEAPLTNPATCAYVVTAFAADGTQVGQTTSVAAPNYVHVSASYEGGVNSPVEGADAKKLQVSPTGWIRVRCGSGNESIPLSQDSGASRDERLLTDAEQAFHSIMNAVQNYQFASQSPFFERLCLHVDVPVPDEPIPGMPHEMISVVEAMHEDLYFSLNEYFKIREGKDINERTSQPGQIVPYTKYAGKGVRHYSVKVLVAPFHITHVAAPPVADLATADHPIPLQEAQQYVDRFEHGTALSVPTVCGQQVRAVRVKKGSGAHPVYMNGAQHANETSGVIGVLRTAQALATRDKVDFVVCPVENPDGYCLHQEYIRTTPNHMLHAARYTALGDDLEYRIVSDKRPLFEKGMRYEARSATNAVLHLNLHGYPSHEWTRPFSGYLPAGFELWTIPKGFFLVVRYNDAAEWGDYAEAFTQTLTKRLGVHQSVLDMNARQVELYRQHAGDLDGFRVVNGFPCMVMAVKDYIFPLTVYTEYPDETIYGDDFVAAHNIQHAFAMCAYDVHQELFEAFSKDHKLPISHI